MKNTIFIFIWSRNIFNIVKMLHLNEDKYEEYSWWEGGWKLGMLEHDSIMNGNPKW